MDTELSDRAFVFWPVGCGDSTTVKVGENVFMQIDLHHPADDSEYNPVIDSLMSLLPEIEPGVRYLAVFALTHAHEDHCKGFRKLLDLVDAGELRIGELWFSPRIFRDAVNADESLCVDAQAFTGEALRRTKEVCAKGEKTPSGDRVRVIGGDDILTEDEYSQLPDRFKSRPGEVVTVLDGVHFDESEFRAFLHAPFSDEAEGERNDASVAMQVRLGDGGTFGRLLIFGDLEAASLKRIFDYSDPDDVAWDLFLAPHHCSRSALFEKNASGEYVLQHDLVLAISDAANADGRVIASSTGDFTDDAGSYPPHQMAREQYEAVAPDGFFCTAEYPSSESNDPIVFSVAAGGVADDSRSAAGAVAAAASIVKPFAVVTRRPLVESPGG